MASLVVTSADGQTIEIPLNPGANRLGRADDNDILVPDASVSSHHAELLVDNGQIFLRDLGSTNGTTINGAPAQESAIQPGDLLRFGDVEFLLQEDASAAPPVPSVRMPAAAPVPQANACRNHLNLAGTWECRKCHERYCEQCILDGRALGVPKTKFCPVCRSLAHPVIATGPGGKPLGQKSFADEMLAAWIYPFRGEGPVILVIGAICLTIASVGVGFLLILGTLVYVMAMGYFMAYAEKVVISSADGEPDPPTWPEFSNYWDDILVPFGHALGLFALYLLPFFLVVFFLPKEPGNLILAAGLLLVALFMMPMAWLAISMHSTIVGLSPHFVIPSILRIPGQYTALFFELVILVAITIAVGRFLERLAIPVVVPLVSNVFSIYFVMVICRLLGVMYHLNRDRLRWL